MADRKTLKGGLNVVKRLLTEEEPASKISKILETKKPPMTTPSGTGLPLMPREQGMYTPREQKDLPRMVGVDKARAAGVSPKYNERMQDLLDSRKARGKVDTLINKGKDLNVQEWYGTEPLRQVAMDAGRSPAQFESLMAQLASASQRNPVDKQNQMGSYLYHLSETGQLPENALLLTNKLKAALKKDPSLAEGRQLVELPTGYGSLAQGDIFNRAVQIGQGDIAGALPPNKKLGTFYENLLGNLKPVTVDVNALRGPIIEQGDPRWLTSKLVEKDEKGNIINSYKPREMYDTGEMTMREAQQRPGFWEAAPSGSEYAGFEDLWQRGAKRHNIEPAEAQALGWYGSADVTALKTKPENYVDNLERLIKRTAEQTGQSPTKVMNDFVTGKGFLRKDGGSVSKDQEPSALDKIQAKIKATIQEHHMAAGGGAFKTMSFQKGGKASTAKAAMDVGKRLFSQDVLPAAEYEANLAKLLSESKAPMRLYHGTTATEGGKGTEAIRQIKPSKEGALGSGVYLTPSPAHASGYSGLPNDEAIAMMADQQYSKKMADQFMADRASGTLREGQKGGNMLPVYAQLKNPLILQGHPEPGKHRDPMIEALTKLGMDEDKAARMVEKAYEEKGYIGKQVQSRAQAQGYDGIMQYRDGNLSEVLSYNPNAIKSATGNRGTFDTSSPDLSKAHGGLTRAFAGGGITTGAGSFSPEDVGMTAAEMNAPAIPAYVKQNASKLMDEGRAQLEKEYSQLKTPQGRADFIKRLGTALIGSPHDMLHMGLELGDYVQTKIPGMSKPESVMLPSNTKDRVPKVSLANLHTTKEGDVYGGSSGFNTELKKLKFLGENEFPMMELPTMLFGPAVASKAGRGIKAMASKAK
jgi:hypothetical protein